MPKIDLEADMVLVQRTASVGSFWGSTFVCRGRDGKDNGTLHVNLSHIGVCRDHLEVLPKSSEDY